MDTTNTSTFLYMKIMAFLGRSTVSPLSHSTQNSNSNVETVSPLYGTTTKNILVMSLGWTRQGGWMAHQSRRCSTGTVGREKSHGSINVERSKGDASAMK